MKQLYTAILAILMTAVSYAQCTPNPPSNSPGIYPPPGGSVKQDSIYVLPSVNYNRAYSQTVHIVVPQDTTVPIPGGGTITADIDSMRVLSVDNMPAWLSYACDNNACSWPGGTDGCFNFSGTSPAANSTILMEGHIEAFANLGQFGQVVDTFSVWIEISVDGTVGIANQELATPRVGPNPTSKDVTVSFNTPRATSWKFELMDITGRVVTVKSGRATSGSNQVYIQRENWPGGMYLYRFSLNGDVHTGRLIVQDGL